MYPLDFESRIENTQRNRKQRVNCHGATLYLLGRVDPEEYVGPCAYRINWNLEIVSRHQELPEAIPTEAQAFGIWVEDIGIYLHTGVIHPFDRQFVIHREDIRQPLSFTTISRLVSTYPYEVTPQSSRSLDFLKLKEPRNR